MRYGLFLDDDALTPGMEDFRYPDKKHADFFKVAISNAEAMAIVSEFGCPCLLDLDHDLGDGETAMFFVKWLYEKYPNEHVMGLVHSRNPEGKKNLEAFMHGWNDSAIEHQRAEIAKNARPIEGREIVGKPVHSIMYAQQPTIQFACDKTWSEPSWLQKPGAKEEKASLPKETYLADDGRLYSFNDDLITCRKCLGLE